MRKKRKFYTVIASIGFDVDDTITTLRVTGQEDVIQKYIHKSGYAFSSSGVVDERVVGQSLADVRQSLMKSG